jgi:hypothetical protein
MTEKTTEAWEKIKQPRGCLTLECARVLTPVRRHQKKAPAQKPLKAKVSPSEIDHQGAHELWHFLQPGRTGPDFLIEAGNASPREK